MVYVAVPKWEAEPGEGYKDSRVKMERWKVREEEGKKGDVMARFICWLCRLDPAESRGELQH